MKLDKLKISFDPTVAWEGVFFRQFIQSLISQTDNYDVYLVTTNTDVDFINNVTSESGIDANNVYQVANNTAVVAKLTTLKALIYLSQDNVLCDYVNSTIPIQLNKNNVVGSQAIVLNNVLDTYKAQMKYFTYFNFWEKQILKQYDKEEIC